MICRGFSRFPVEKAVESVEKSSSKKLGFLPFVVYSIAYENEIVNYYFKMLNILK